MKICISVSVYRRVGIMVMTSLLAIPLHASSVSDSRDTAINLSFIFSAGVVAYDWITNSSTPASANAALEAFEENPQERAKLALAEELQKKLSRLIQQRKLAELDKFKNLLLDRKDALIDTDYIYLYNVWAENKAHLLVALGKYSEAKQTLRFCLDKQAYNDPEHIYYLYGKTLWKLGETTAAKEWFSKVSPGSSYYGSIPKEAL